MDVVRVSIKCMESSFAGMCLGTCTCIDEACIQNLHAQSLHNVYVHFSPFQIWTSDVYWFCNCVPLAYSLVFTAAQWGTAPYDFVIIMFV